jgi:hypothetical protein
MKWVLAFEKTLRVIVCIEFAKVVHGAVSTTFMISY